MRVGFCGLGIMGSRMAAHVVAAGHEVTVWTHTPGKAQAWADEHGARAADTPTQAAEGADAVITMLVDGAQVAWALEGVTEPLCIDMSTIGAPAARALAEGRRFIDAPVSGSTPGAESGTLTIMVGGAPEDVEAAMPLLRAMGERIVHAGPVGHGQAIKVITNAVAAANAATLAQALAVGQRCGLDTGALIELLGATASASRMVDLKARPMVDRDYTTLFKLEQMLKDVRLCLEQAHEVHAPFPAAAEAAELLEGGMARGLGEADFAAVKDVVDGLAGQPAVSP